MLVRNHIKLQTCTTAAAAPALPPPKARLELFLRMPCQSMACTVGVDDDADGATVALSAAIAVVGSPPSVKMTPALTTLATKKARREDKDSSVVTSLPSSAFRICRVFPGWIHDVVVFTGSVRGGAGGGRVEIVVVSCRTTRSTTQGEVRATTGVSKSNHPATANKIIETFIMSSKSIVKVFIPLQWKSF